MDKLQNAGIPENETNKWLESLGYKSTNDRAIKNVLKQIGFTDSSGAPQQNWKDYRIKSKAGAVLAQAIRAGYAGLFHTYPDAPTASDDDLKDFFKSHTSSGEAAVTAMAYTFKALCAKADFTVQSPVAATEHGGQADPPGKRKPAVGKSATGIGTGTPPPPTDDRFPDVKINIELTLPPGMKAKDYEEFFRALRKELYDKQD